MDGLSPQERLILDAIELELQRSGTRLAGQFEAFNAKAGQRGPQRWAAHVSGWEVAAVFAMVLITTGVLTLLILSCE